jgi:ribulose-phosphate 3-epimerase
MALIAPSILTADFLRLGDELRRAKGADVWHLDIMDGHFVPNLTFGPLLCAAVAKASEIPVECHLMVERPQELLPRYAEAGARRLIVHAEATPHLHRLIAQIRDLGCEVGVALNPGTPLGVIEEVAADLDLLLIMTVDPGFGGQSFQPRQVEKIRRARELLPKALIEVDGGIGPNTAPEVVRAGADILVAGSAVFAPGADPQERIAEIRRSLHESR